MEKSTFRIPDHDAEARLRRLRPAQAKALEQALARLQESASAGGGRREGFPHFLLPLAESGLSGEQMLALAERVPGDFPLDHRDIYFDFRLGRWMRHIEPPTLSDCLEDYLESAGSRDEGMAYLRGEWRDFLRRHGAEEA